MTTADTPVRVGIVGLGGIGTHHADRIVDLGHDLVGGMDVDETARHRFEAEYDVPTVESFDDLTALDVEAVVVTTPNKYHEQYAIAALDAGLPVLLEKPLAHDLDSAERIVDAAASAESFLMVGFNNRFIPPAEVVTAAIDEGRFGDVTHVEANYVRRRGVPGRGGWFTTKAVSGGGALIDLGVHAIDLALHFLGHPTVVEVAGETRSEFGGREDYTYLDMYGPDHGADGFDVDDSAQAFIRGADGKTVALEVAWAENRPPNHDFVVQGTAAGAQFDLLSGDLELYETGTAGRPHLSTTSVETAEVDAHRAEERRFLSAVRTGEPPERNTPEQALRVQRVIDAIYRSSTEGRAIRLD